VRVLMPLPDRDFDTTEVAVPWRLLTDAGHTVTVATEEGGRRPACDPRLLTGVIFGQLGAEPEPIEFATTKAIGHRSRSQAGRPDFVSPGSCVSTGTRSDTAVTPSMVP
jgi:putative intracellular protease/amidase